MPKAPPTHRSLISRGRRQADQAYERRRQADPALRLSKQIRNSARWQRFRQWFRQAHPLCCDPFKHHKRMGQVVAIEQVHHILGLTERPDLAFDEENCAPLCGACHAKVEGMARAGKPTAHLFDRALVGMEGREGEWG